MERLKPSQMPTGDIMHVFESFDLLSPGLYGNLTESQQRNVLLACGVDPDNPNAYQIALENAHGKMQKFRNAIMPQLWKR